MIVPKYLNKFVRVLWLKVIDNLIQIGLLRKVSMVDFLMEAKNWTGFKGYYIECFTTGQKQWKMSLPY